MAAQSSLLLLFGSPEGKALWPATPVIHAYVPSTFRSSKPSHTSPAAANVPRYVASAGVSTTARWAPSAAQRSIAPS
jgi:hypothetical protein